MYPWLLSTGRRDELREAENSDENGMKMRNRGGKTKQKKEEDMNKRERGRGRAVNADEMVIASCLLMVGLEGCQTMTRAAKLFPPDLSLLFLILPVRCNFADNCRNFIERTTD